MTRLGSIGPRAVHQPLTLAIYDTLEGDTDWDYVAGAVLAALTAGNTLNVTSRHHKVSIVGGTIDNIADAAGASEGQLLELYSTAATTIRNNGGGAGNIRTISGQDLAIAANDIVELVYDGANWRECARTNVNLPTTGQIVWGSLADTNLYRAAGGVVKTDGSFQVASTVTTGGTAFGTGGGGNAGVYVDNAGRVQSTQTVNVNILASSRTTDTQFRFTIDSTGAMSWGPGGSTAPDTTLARTAAATLTLTGNLTVSALCQQAKSLEAAPATTNQAGGTTWSPTFTNGLVQRVNVTSAGTLTIATPGVPPAGFSGLLVLVIHNASGGAITLAWNAVYSGSTPLAPSNGTGIIVLLVYNPGTGKWSPVSGTSGSE